MNKVYLLGPIVALAVFGAVYSQYARTYATRLAEDHRKEAAAKVDKVAADDAAQTRALALAQTLQIKRNAERAEKDRIDAIQKQARLTLEELRSNLFKQTAELRPQVAVLQRELADLAKSIRTASSVHGTCSRMNRKHSKPSARPRLARVFLRNFSISSSRSTSPAPNPPIRTRPNPAADESQGEGLPSSPAQPTGVAGNPRGSRT